MSRNRKDKNGMVPSAVFYAEKFNHWTSFLSTYIPVLYYLMLTAFSVYASVVQPLVYMFMRLWCSL